MLIEVEIKKIMSTTSVKNIWFVIVIEMGIEKNNYVYTVDITSLFHSLRITLTSVFRFSTDRGIQNSRE